MVITLNIQISKARVMDEVAKTTEYIGQKAVSEQDPGAYERIAATDANREQLERYWMEACASASLLLDHWATSISDQRLSHHVDLSRDYKVTLSLPTNWPAVYSKTIEEQLAGYLVDSIVAKWLMVTHRQDAALYAALANGAASQVSSLLLARKRPARRRSSGADDGLWHRADIWHRDELW